MDNLNFAAIIGALAVLLDFSIRLAAIAYIPNNRKPSAATAWLLAIFFIPVIGGIAFLLFGSNKLSKKRRSKQRRINTLILERTKGASTINEENRPPKWFESLAILNTRLGALPLVGGNNAKLYDDYDGSINAMAKLIDGAKAYVHAEFFIMSLDPTSQPFFTALANAKKRGVIVRVLLDHMGSMPYPDYKQTIAYLDANEIDWRLMLPFQPLKGKIQRPDLRNHRKILVVDGERGFTGSQNIIDRSYNKKKNKKAGLMWHELMAKVEGPIVAELNALFVNDWYAETDELLTNEMPHAVTNFKDMGDLDCQIVPSGPGFDGENNLKMFNSLMYNAQKKIIITSPYFVPDESMLNAITTAAERGLEVVLFVSEIGDQWLVYHAQRSYYEALLRAGVRIYMYKSPYVLHAKHVTVDDTIAVIGSSNMDIRSFSLNMEVSLLVYSKAFVRDMRKIEAKYFKNSRELTLHTWLKRSKYQKFADNITRLTSALQ